MTKLHHALFTPRRKLRTLIPSFQAACLRSSPTRTTVTSEGFAHALCVSLREYSDIVTPLDFLMLFSLPMMLCFLDFKGGGYIVFHWPTEASVTVVSVHKGMNEQGAISWFEFPFVAAFSEVQYFGAFCSRLK